MQKSFHDMAVRSLQAESKFHARVMDFGFTYDESIIIAKVYVHIGVLSFDSVDGQYYIKHGAFMDSKPMRNALDQSDSVLAGKKVKWKRQ
jgi:hypothetical protein